MRKSLLGTKVIWNKDIKSIGTFVQSKYSAITTPVGFLNKKEWLDFNMIYICESSDLNLNKWRMAKHIRLQFRPIVYERILYWIKVPYKKE